MFNPLSFISKFIKSGNQKELDRISVIEKDINALEKKFKSLSNDDFPKNTQDLYKFLKFHDWVFPLQ